jgi:cysteine desulfurase
MRRIDLAYNASTPIEPEVAAVLQLMLAGAFGNPSGLHWAGPPAGDVVEGARRQVAGVLDCAAGEVAFTSGGSYRKRRQIIATRIEHPAIVAPLRFLERLGAEVTWLGRRTSLVSPEDLRRAISLGRETTVDDIDAVIEMLNALDPVETGAALLG